MFQWVVDETAREERPGVGVAVALYWSLFVGLVCVVLGAGVARQIASEGWPTVDGTITVSELGGSKRNFWKLAYTYAVAGRQYTGTRYAHAPMPIQGEVEVLRHIAEYPVDAALAVYYNPDNPDEAVLRPGLRGCTLWISLALTPFVLVGLGMWVGLVRRRWPRRAFDPADPRQVAAEEGQIVVRPNRRWWPETFLSYLGGTAFGVSWALFVIGFALGAAYWMFDGFLLDPPVAVPATVWAVIVVACALATWRAVRRAPILSMDPHRGMLRFAAAGRGYIEMPFAEINDVVVIEQIHEGRNGRSCTHQVELHHRDGIASVAEYANLRDAVALTDWLRKQIASQSGSG